ncbi:heme NO-binding protein [bacterium]|nr:heme NO-binding protein [bacterium]
MLGLINRSFQFFLSDTYGVEFWENVAKVADIRVSGFESMLIYDDKLINQVIDAASALLRRPRESLMEDMGTYLVSHESLQTVRRLLRFSGVNFGEFLNSMEELPERGRLVLPELELPEMELCDLGGGHFRLRCRARFAGTGHIVMGLLRAMADDYGALVLLDHLGLDAGGEVISVQIADQALYEARPFSLGLSVG